MAVPTTRDTFKEFCLRKLGKPVIEINVADEQVEDRIDESLSYYWDYHFDGTEKTYFKHQVTATDKTNGYIDIPENIIGAVRIFNMGSSITSSNMFSAKYQFTLNNLHEFTNYNLTNYAMTMQYLRTMEEILVGQKGIRYNRHINRLYIDMDWDVIAEGDYLIAECYSIVDPGTYADVWKDRWLQEYTTSKIKLQWGSNLIKFIGMQMPGGVQFNGELIYQEAKEEILRLEEEMISSYSLPVSDMIG